MGNLFPKEMDKLSLSFSLKPNQTSNLPFPSNLIWTDLEIAEEKLSSKTIVKKVVAFVL